MTSEDLEILCREVVEAHTAERKAYQTARRKLVGYLMGQTLRANPNLNPEKTKSTIEKIIDEIV